MELTYKATVEIPTSPEFITREDFEKLAEITATHNYIKGHTEHQEIVDSAIREAILKSRRTALAFLDECISDLAKNKIEVCNIFVKNYSVTNFEFVFVTSSNNFLHDAMVFQDLKWQHIFRFDSIAITATIIKKENLNTEEIVADGLVHLRSEKS